jgi:hypothetical protein
MYIFRIKRSLDSGGWEAIKILISK